MDEPKKLKSPILEIWRRLKEQRKKNQLKEKNEKPEKNSDS